MKKPIVKTNNITKLYPGTVALDSVDFDLHSGEVHVLFGENGAGKSTLISMLAGSNSPTSGTLTIDDKEVKFSSVADAQAHGVYTVFQEFSLIPTMNVAQNLFLGREPKNGIFIDYKTMKIKSQKILTELGFNINPTRLVSALSRAEQQMVEIAKALMGNVKVLILDEPTASLTDREVDHLFKFILDLKAKGVGIVYISHRMQEFDRIGDRITILRDGAKIDTVHVKDTDEQKLVELMTGRQIAGIYPEISTDFGEDILKVDSLTSVGVNNASFTIKSGEVLGISGLVGSGKSRLCRLIMGLGTIFNGQVQFKGEDITSLSTRDVMKHGIYYLSPDRKAEGLDLASTSISNLEINLVMSELSQGKKWINWQKIKTEAHNISDHIELNDDYRNKMVSQLSGGNQQKVLFGKCFSQDAELIIFDEPTVGVDMGTRSALYQMIKQLAEDGKAVIIISSDLPEVMNLSHRLIVMNKGRIAATLDKAEISEDKILKHFFEESH